ncbi:MAG: CD225/dispanin family protein [Mariniphaga sp.]|nr:CD225/dispanin family protein [Mariniphaga sp.]
MERIDKPQDPPPNYLVWAILTTIFCCLPFGIVSIVFAAQVNSKWQAEDYDGAMNSSKNAKIWAWVSFAVAIGGFIIWSLLAVLGVVAGFWADAINW